MQGFLYFYRILLSVLREKRWGRKRERERSRIQYPSQGRWKQMLKGRARCLLKNNDFESKKEAEWQREKVKCSPPPAVGAL